MLQLSLRSMLNSQSLFGKLINNYLQGFRIINKSRLNEELKLLVVPLKGHHGLNATVLELFLLVLVVCVDIPSFDEIMFIIMFLLLDEPVGLFFNEEFVLHFLCELNLHALVVEIGFVFQEL